MPKDALTAFQELDGTDLQGRLMHIIPGDEKRTNEEDLEGKTLKEKREIERRKQAGRGGDWGTLFMNVTLIFSTRLILIARCSFVLIGRSTRCIEIRSASRRL